MKLCRLCAAVFMTALLAACASRPEYRISDITQARAVSDLGLDLFIAGDHEGAIRALDAVVAYGSIDDAVFARRAAVYGTMKNYDKALVDANRAIELAPRAWRRYLERAILYQRIGEYGSAITDLDSAIAIQPNEVALLRRRAYLKVVDARFDDAVADYENLSNILPRSDTGALGRGAALYLAGRWPEAASQFASMLKAREDDGLAALWLAKARIRAGQFLLWEEVEPGAGDEPEWRMTRALLTMESETEVAALIDDVEPCEKALFTGFWLAFHKKPQGAERFYRAALEACPLDSIEGSETRVELARLRDAQAQ